MSIWGQIAFKEPVSEIMLMVDGFYRNVSVVGVFVLSLVFYFMVFVLCSKLIDRHTSEYGVLEAIWTLIPIVLLIMLAMPSIMLLYISDESAQPLMILKVIGHQWFWEYEYTKFEGVTKSVNSYMKNNDSLLGGEYRLLEVDSRALLPANTMVRVLVTSYDVIHSWCLSSMGVKIDAVPGRLNGVSVYADVLGVMYGQCSEFCGSDHAFMPIVLEFVMVEDFIQWLDGEVVILSPNEGVAPPSPPRWWPSFSISIGWNYSSSVVPSFPKEEPLASEAMSPEKEVTSSSLFSSNSYLFSEAQSIMMGQWGGSSVDSDGEAMLSLSALSEVAELPTAASAASSSLFSGDTSCSSSYLFLGAQSIMMGQWGGSSVDSDGSAGLPLSVLSEVAELPIAASAASLSLFVPSESIEVSEETNAAYGCSKRKEPFVSPKPSKSYFDSGKYNLNCEKEEQSLLYPRIKYRVNEAGSFSLLVPSEVAELPTAASAASLSLSALSEVVELPTAASAGSLPLSASSEVVGLPADASVSGLSLSASSEVAELPVSASAASLYFSASSEVVELPISASAASLSLSVTSEVAELPTDASVSSLSLSASSEMVELPTAASAASLSLSVPCDKSSWDKSLDKELPFCEGYDEDNWRK